MTAVQVNASSAAGLIGFLTMGPYVASKHAVMHDNEERREGNPAYQVQLCSPRYVHP